MDLSLRRGCLVSALLVMVLLFPAAGWPAGKEIPIKAIKVEGLYTINSRELIYMLCLNKAKALDPENLQRGIKRAFRKGIFEYISVSEDSGEKGLIIIQVREKDTIAGVDFTGARNLPSKFLKSSFPMAKGQFMRYDLIDSASAKLRDALSQAGYPAASVKVSVERKPKKHDPYRVKLLAAINEGKPLIVKKVEIIGQAGSEARKYIKISPGDVYDQVKLKEGMGNLRDYYKKRDYINPVIGPYNFYDGELYISVTPGRRYEADFYGNKALSKRKLKRLLPFSEAGDFNEDLVNEAVVKMRTLYGQNGYPFAQIAPVIVSKDGLVRVNFYIAEGEKVKIKSINFTGTAIPASRIQSFLELKKGEVYNPQLLDSDRSTISDLLESLGYLDARVSEPRVRMAGKAEAVITYDITEGRQYRITSVTIEGGRSFPAAEISNAVGIKPGSIYNELDISNAKFRILELYNDAGFANASVDVEREFKDSGAAITYKINEGKKLYFGKYVVAGNTHTDIRIIRRELEYDEGAPFSQKKLMEERQRLYELGLFKSVDAGILDMHGDTVDVIYKVTESKPGTFEFGVGYGDYEKYRGFAGASYRNLFGMDRGGSIRFEFSSLERRLILNYYEPWFLGGKLPFRAFILAEKREEKNIDTGEISYKLTRYSANAGVEKKFGRKLKGELYYEFSLVNTYDVKPDVVLSREDVGTLAISALRPALAYDTRDNAFNPRKGVLAGVTLKLASAAFLSETNFIKGVVQASTYHSLSKVFILALNGKIGLAKGLGHTNELPLVERFFLGGRNSVRGYAQDTLGPKGADGTPIGGNAFVLGNIELRTMLGKNWGIVPFLDMGNVWIRASDISLGDLKYATGLGLRYNTPVGPLRLDYGIKLNREPGESHGELNFSIGQAF
ncbi:MAG: outer membrane protein assembly factor BamA [Nitrospiraceae bacterium]|nr:outer membrane protein assembly factor BamA [Nitrospiraceae bacterium]